jgi:hypothetical protein
MKYYITILALVFITSFGYSQGQNPPDSTKVEENQEVIEGVTIEMDTTNYEDSFDLGGINFGQDEYYKNESSPTIDLTYLMVNPSFYKDGFQSKFAKAAGLEIRLGYVDKTSIYGIKDMFELDHKFFMLSNLTTDLASASSIGKNEIKTNVWRFGIGSSTGYGWKLGEKTDIALYNSGGITWSKIDFKDTTSNLADNDKMKRFGDSFRFGTFSEDGIKINVYKPISVNIAYERSLVFSRTMFWYWAASEITESIAHGLIDTFIDKVIEKSPIAGPIVNWVLKGGISYGMNLLRSKHMNWPVLTADPYFNDNIKASFSFSF